LPLEFHRDKQGVTKAVWSGDDNSGRLLAQFFESDLGADAGYSERLKIEAEKHHHGHAPPWRTSGNAFSITMENSKVTVRPLFGADQHLSHSIDVSDFLSLLHRWHEATS
jgi:hypothetical protein